MTVEIEGEDKPALIADWLSLYMLAVGRRLRGDAPYAVRP